MHTFATTLKGAKHIFEPIVDCTSKKPFLIVALKSVAKSDQRSSAISISQL